MKTTRRTLLQGAAATMLAGSAMGQSGGHMYGLIGKVKAVPGKRDELARILLDSTREMPGCLSYVVATDGMDPDALWITEVWENEAKHQASLSLPGVKDAIAKGGPLIASFEQRHITEPLGGHGVAKRG